MKRRVTIQLEPALLSEAKQFAARTQRTFAAVVEDALRVALYQPARHKRPRRVKLPVPRHTSAVRPGVDLSNMASLLDVMESDSDTAGR